MKATAEKNRGSYRMQRLAVWLLIVIGAGTGCAGRNPHSTSAGFISGYWSTDRDVIMQVRPGKRGTYEAAIFASPGIVASGFETGTVVIGNDIRWGRDGIFVNSSKRNRFSDNLFRDLQNSPMVYYAQLLDKFRMVIIPV